MNKNVCPVDLFDFYKRQQILSKLTPSEVADIIGIDLSLVDFYENAVKKIEIIYQLLDKYPDKSFQYICNRVSVPEEEGLDYFLVIQMHTPGLVKKKNIKNSPLDKELNNAMICVAIDESLEEDLFDHEIAAKLNISTTAVRDHRNSLPVTQQRTQEFNALKKEALVREFFKLYPFSTISEAAKTLKIHNREVRTIVELLVKSGEKIKFNNTPKPIEFETRKAKIVEMKKQNPSITDKEISLALGVSLSQVRQAIQDTIRIWQIERANSYDFYFNNTMEELTEIKKLAKERHNAGDATSSRWLEISLIAIEKQINILGLKAPEKVEFNGEMVFSKKDKDSLIEAFMATDAVDVDFKQIEVTGNK